MLAQFRKALNAAPIAAWLTTGCQGLAGACLVGFALHPAPALAQDAVHNFDIPQQDLAAALQQLARQAEVQILFPFEAAQDRRNQAVRGRMTTRRALAIVLDGHDLIIASYGGGRITLRAIRARSAGRTGTSPTAPSRPARPPSPPPAPPPPAVILVTGRALSVPLDDSSYSYAVSVIEREDLDRQPPLSTADLFRQVPGFWVESSGGEAGNNVRSRGIPTDGFSSIALAENGIPVQYDGALGYLNTDQSYRIDDTIERVEAVRGGPASLFTPNAPGGVINVIPRSGLREEGGRTRVTAADRGYLRIDSYLAARLGENWGLLVGGFLRRDDGRRDLSYTADEGGQVRLALDYRSGWDSVSLDVRRLDDRVSFYLPVPLQLDDQRRPTAIAGFDPLRASLSGPETQAIMLSDGGTPALFDLTRGTQTSLTAITTRATLALGGGLTWQGSLRWRRSDTVRNALFPTGSPMTAQSYLTGIEPTLREQFPATDRLALRYAANGAAFDPAAHPNGLVTGANLLSVSVPLREVIADNRLTGQITAQGQHNLALGLTLARYSYRFDRYMATVLLEVANHARLLDAVALDQRGGVGGRYTDRGVQRYGSIFDQVGIATTAIAIYAADEWQVAPDLRIDLGARWETNAISGEALGKTVLDLGDPATLADDRVIAPDGTMIAIDRNFAGFGWSAGASYKLASGFGLFARYTHAFRLPSASEFNTSPLRSDQATVPIRMAEAGVKLDAPRWSLHATGFLTGFARLPFTDFRFDTQTNAYVERTEIAATRTWGIEVEATWDPPGAFEMAMHATWQDPQYRNFTFTEVVDGQPAARDYSGNQLIRVPRLALRAVPSLTWRRLRAGLTAEYFSRRFADLANGQSLPGYALVGLHAEAKLSPQLTITGNVTNLFNVLGLTEGNPRAGSFDVGQARTHFFARPEFARSLSLSLAFAY